MADEVKDVPKSASPEANRLLADALKMPMVSNYTTVVKDLKAPELPKREAIVPEKTPALPAGKEYLAQMKPSLEAIKVAEQGELERQADLKLLDAQMQGEKYKQLSESAAKQKQDILADPARADYRRALEDKAKPFVPHEENAQDLMMLFGLLNVVGFAIGSGGKEYSQAAMSAMNGMLEGHQKGRDDLYKKEKSIFETNQKQLDSRIKQLLAFMQDNELLTGMDKTARDQAIEGEFLKNKADTLKEFYKKRGYGPTVEYLKSVSQASDKAITATMEENRRAAREEFDIRKMQAQFEGDRQKDADNFTRQISLKQQELQQKALEAHEARDFELQRDAQNQAFTLKAALASYAHSEYLAKLNRDHADAIELARKAEAAGDRQATADYRKEQQRIEAERDKATADFRKDQLALERQRLNAEKQPTNMYTDPATGTMYQYDVNKRSWVKAPGLPAGVEKVGVGGAKPGAAGGQDVALIQTYGFPRNEVARLNKDTLPTTVAIVYSAEQTKKLANDVKNNPDAAGLALSFLKNIDKYLPSRYDTTDADSGVSYLQSQADKEITGSNPTTVSKARMIAKDVVDVINARALAASGGKRVLVSELRMQKDVLGLEGMSAKSAVDVFNGLAEKDIDSLKKYGFSPETLTGVKSRVLGSSKAGAETGRDEKGSFHYEYNEDKTKRRKVYD